MGILATELADELAPSAGLRNRLVHEYDEIDDEVVHRSIGTTLDLYRRYVAGVELYLEEKMMPHNRSD